MPNPAILTKKDAEKILSFRSKTINQKNTKIELKKPSIEPKINSNFESNETAFPGHIFISLSLNLGKTEEKIQINTEEHFALIRNEKVSFKELEKTKEETFYTIIEGKVLAIELFGEDTNLYYKLKPTLDWPTIMLSSVPMHRFKTVSPKTSAQLMVKEISPIKGIVLDCCCGLGYTSIIEANEKDCEKVIVFEKDEHVLEMAKYNPYSNELFTNPKINLFTKSVVEGIKKIENNSIDRILHDPPTTSFGKELYSIEFYRELHRVLKPKGLFYHYCPNPGKTKGTNFWPTIEKMLKKSGFVNIHYHAESSGLVATKK